VAAPSLTYTLTNGTTADASQVMQNFNDLLNGITDGSKDLSISALTVAGTATLNGNVALGNSSADTLTVTASLASGLVPDSTGVRSLGSSAIGFLDLYLAASTDADTARIVAAAHSADRVYTVPDSGADASFVMTQGAQTLTGVKTYVDVPVFNAGILLDDAGGSQTALNFHQLSETSGNLASSEGTYVLKAMRIGSFVMLHGSVTTATGIGTSVVGTAIVPSGMRPSTDISNTGQIDASGLQIFVATITSAGTLSFAARDGTLGNGTLANSTTYYFSMCYSVLL